MQIPVFSENISHELNFLLYSFSLGIIITFVYDNIRIFRCIIKHNSFFIAIEDLIFWIAVTFSIFTLQYYENNGMFRWFSIIGAFLGMNIYRVTISRIYVNLVSKILLFMIKWFIKIMAFLLKPVFFMEYQTRRGIRKTGRGLHRVYKNLRNRLTLRSKMIKITLCKHNKVQ